MRHRLYILNRYFNGGYFTAAEGIAASITPGLIFSKNAGLIIKLQQFDEVSSSPVKKISIPFYSSKNENVIELINALERLKEHIVIAVLHGSLADGEECSYSDIDTFIVVKNNVFEDRNTLVKVATSINGLRAFMHRHDPLQHHGWFVLSEKDLLSYPEDFLPIEAIERGCSLIEGQCEFDVRVKQNPDWYFSFDRLAKSIKKKLTVNPSEYSLFQIKAVLSEFMMLAVNYVQARDKKGIYKKDAFDEMRKDFSIDEYRAMDEVSAIRFKWKIQISDRDRRFLERTDFLSWRKRKKMPLEIPVSISTAFNEELFLRMNILVNAALKKLNK